MTDSQLPVELGTPQPAARESLRRIIRAKTGQNVGRCLGCGTCNINRPQEEFDVSLDSLIQMVLEDDEEVLSTRTLWSETVFDSVRYACQRGLNLQEIFHILRIVAKDRHINLE